MIKPIHADLVASIADLKKNPGAVIAASEDCPVAILDHNAPAAYLVSAATWKGIVDRLNTPRLGWGEDAAAISAESTLV